LNDDNLSFDTRVVHAGEPRPRIGYSVAMPIFQSSTFEYTGEAKYDDIRYLRLNNTPNHIALGEKIASLEKAESGLVVSSGMAAITSTLLAVVSEGKHLLAQDDLYGGTNHFLTEVFTGMGREVTLFSQDDLGSLKEKIRPNTVAIYIEGISNPMLRVPDLAKVVEFARTAGLISIIDNTIASPCNFTPIEAGFDIVLHSATKYLNGHTDIVAGAISGKRETIAQITNLVNLLGGCLDPHACFLLSRGLKTLGVRVRHQNQSALQVAKFLESCDQVEKVFYPALESHPDYAHAKKWMRGGSGMVSFLYKGTEEELDKFLGSLKIAVNAPSLGGPETLVTIPAKTSHSTLSSEDRKRLGIAPTLVRLSVGLEDPGDLIHDISRALELAKSK
jgi:cystathionine beta-lyase/cystathionine gamma-synthase